MDKIDEKRIRNALAFDDLTEEEKAKRHILGRLYGPIADVVRPTRNGRKYSEELWEKVFDNPIMKEKFRNKVMYGELGHPEDRTEVDMSKVAVCMPEAPKKDRDGHLIGYFDILDTPNGRILKTLCDYGSTLGVSSRGTGDVVEGLDGEEEVDPDTYECECWDIVLVPAVESARLAFTEGLSKKGRLPLREALEKQIGSASEEDRAVMEDAVKALGLGGKAEGECESAEAEGPEAKEAKAPEAKAEEAKAPEAKAEEAKAPEAEAPECKEADGKPEDGKPVDEGKAECESAVKEEGKPMDYESARALIKKEFGSDLTPELYRELTKAFGSGEGEESKEECVGGSDGRRADNPDRPKEGEGLREEAADGGSEVANSLKEALKANAGKDREIKELKERLAVGDAKVSELEGESARQKSAMARMSKVALRAKEAERKVSALEERLKARDARLRLLSAKAREADGSALRESLAKKDGEIAALSKQVEELRKGNAELKSSLGKAKGASLRESASLRERAEKAEKSAAGYMAFAEKAASRYLETKATAFGISPRDVRRRLPENYTLDDIDRACESLRSYSLRVGKLPFAVGDGATIAVRESKPGNGLSLPKGNGDDDLDEATLRLAGISGD